MFLLLKGEEILLQHSSLLLLLWLLVAHKIAIEMVMEMEYLTQVTTVLITLIQDALKKEILVQLAHISSSNRHLLLLIIGLGTRQDKER